MGVCTGTVVAVPEPPPLAQATKPKTVAALKNSATACLVKGLHMPRPTVANQDSPFMHQSYVMRGDGVQSGRCDKTVKLTTT
jgi:hypothetical protein